LGTLTKAARWPVTRAILAINCRNAHNPVNARYLRLHVLTVVDECYGD
jgi:hypothetical protein